MEGAERKKTAAPLNKSLSSNLLGLKFMQRRAESAKKLNAASNQHEAASDAQWVLPTSGAQRLVPVSCTLTPHGAHCLCPHPAPFATALPLTLRCPDM